MLPSPSQMGRGAREAWRRGWLRRWKAFPDNPHDERQNAIQFIAHIDRRDPDNPDSLVRKPPRPPRVMLQLIRVLVGAPIHLYR